MKLILELSPSPPPSLPWALCSIQYMTLETEKELKWKCNEDKKKKKVQSVLPKLDLLIFKAELE